MLVCMFYYFLEVSLINSNLLFYLVCFYLFFYIWSRGKVYYEIFGFYNSWDEESLEFFIVCDNEF